MAERWRGCAGVDKVDHRGGRGRAALEDANAVLPRLFEAAAAAGSRITEVNVTEPNLEMVFLHLTGRALQGMTQAASRARRQMKILAIAWKDLRSTSRNVPALAMMLVAPLALAALLGFAFGGGGSFRSPRPRSPWPTSTRAAPSAGQSAGAAHRRPSSRARTSRTCSTTSTEERLPPPRGRPSTTARRRSP